MIHFRIPPLKNTGGLPLAAEPDIVTLQDGAVFHLHVGKVRLHIAGTQVNLLAFNGSIPGPAIKVRQGARISVYLTSASSDAIDLEWHGLDFDCISEDSSGEQIHPVGQMDGGCMYQLYFPEPGVYWYHHRCTEGSSLPSALYGTIVVIPNEVTYWPPVNKEYAMILDEVILDHPSGLAHGTPPAASSVSISAPRVLLMNGENPGRMAGDIGEIIRLYLTNASRNRIFSFAIPGTRMKWVGGEHGRLEYEESLEAVLLPPAGRAVVDVSIEHSGLFPIEQRSLPMPVGIGTLEGDVHPVMPTYAHEFQTLRKNPDFRKLREILPALIRQPADQTLALVRLPDRDISTPARWLLDSGVPAALQSTVHWDLPGGKQSKLRLILASDGGYPAQHPIHFTYQPVLVLSRNHVQNPNLAWQDTLLLSQGEVVDVLLDNSGRPARPVECSTPISDTYF